MTTIGVVVRSDDKEVQDIVSQLENWCTEQGYALVFESDSAALLGRDTEAYPAEKLARETDPIVTLGGDGTMIGVARLVEGASPALVGVNFGHLGFLTEIAPSELLSTLKTVINEKANLEKRALLSLCVEREGRCVFETQAINDVVVEKGAREKLVNLDVYSDGAEVMRTRADGLIVATPTGSTAYSLAAGGSIIFPTLEVMLLTPICPHSLTNRPLILPLQSELVIQIPEGGEEIFVSADGQVSFELLPEDRVLITKAPNSVHFVRSPSKSYFDILRTKLNWAIPNQERR